MYFAIRTASAAFVLSALLMPMAAFAQESASDAKAAFDQGVQLYLTGKYSESFRHLHIAANYGENAAAAMIGAMYLAGERVYGAGVPADPVQARHWLQVASVKSQGAAADHLRTVAAISPKGN